MSDTRDIEGRIFRFSNNKAGCQSILRAGTKTGDTLTVIGNLTGNVVGSLSGNSLRKISGNFERDTVANHTITAQEFCNGISCRMVDGNATDTLPVYADVAAEWLSRGITLEAGHYWQFTLVNISAHQISIADSSDGTVAMSQTGLVDDVVPTHTTTGWFVLCYDLGLEGMALILVNGFNG